MTRIITFLLLITLLVCINVSVVDSQPELSTGDTVGKTVRDQEIIDLLIKAGLDPKTVVLERDYGETVDDGVIGVDFGLASSQTYFNTTTGEKILVVDALPHVDAFGHSIEPEWVDRGSYFGVKQNTFICVVQDDLIVVVAENDQGDGIKNSDTLQFQPQIFLDGNEILPNIRKGELLEVDPINSNYQNNVLFWDYGICKRYLRLIEGRILGFWEFTQVPEGDITFVYNQAGHFRLNLGEFAVDVDTEIVTVEDFKSLFEILDVVNINDSLTFYPDASPESTSSDGRVACWNIGAVAFSSYRNHTGNSAGDAVAIEAIDFMTNSSSNTWKNLSRLIFQFDTSNIPDDASISSATLSLMSYMKQDWLALSANFALNVYGCSPASATAIVAGDYDSFDTPITKFSDTDMTYASVVDEAYNDFELNGTGLAAIDVDGITKYMIMESYYDVGGNTPAWNRANNTIDIGFYMSEQGVGYVPKLVVIYSSGPVPMPGVPGRSNSMFCPQSGPGGAIY